MVNHLDDADALVWLGSEGEDLSTYLHASIKWVLLPAAGVDMWTDLFDDKRVFTGAQGVFNETVAEHAVALLLALVKQLHRYARAASWVDKRQRTPGRLAGSTVTIIGAGGIGQAIIRMLKPFRVEILAVTRSGRPVDGASESVSAANLHQVLHASNHVILSAPATPATHHLLGEREFEQLTGGVNLVNVGRGSVIDTACIYPALLDGRVGGVALDVTDPEPLPSEHPLWREPSVLITPHTGNTPEMYVDGLYTRIEENVSRYRDGRPLLGVVNASAKY